MIRLTKQQLEEIEGHLARGKKIPAIKLYRDFTGASLAEAKKAVEAMVIVPMSAVAVPAESGTRDIPEAELIELLNQGLKIEAIKRYREITGVGLKEAKEAVEALEAKTLSSGTGNVTEVRPNVTTVGCGTSVILLGLFGVVIYLVT